jgi:glutathione-regulated potassium-efflux system ancillary protein KefG
VKKTVILFAHPTFANSRLNKALVAAASEIDGVEIRNLCEIYGNDISKIDVKAEQASLLNNDRIIFQFPLYWYSSPAMLKEWQDKVLEYGFAYGSSGDKLKDKEFLVVTTAGGSKADYDSSEYGLNQILTPFKVTAQFTGMKYGSFFAIYDALNITDEELNGQTLEYIKLLKD